MSISATESPIPPGSRVSDPDASARGILAANVTAIIVALVGGSGLLLLLWPYWIQSVVIGFYAQHRIRLLDSYSTEGLKLSGRSVAPTPATKRKAANFFLLHYGFFHLIYLMALLTFTQFGSVGAGAGSTLTLGTLDRVDVLLALIAGLGFVLSHRASHLEHVATDLRGQPNLGELIFLPYVRIVPMHLTIILALIVRSSGGVLLFGLLKTAADLTLHKVEHHLLQRVVAARAERSNV